MGRGGHGDGGRGDVLGLHAVPNQLVEVGRVHVLVVVPAEPIEGDHQQFVVGLGPSADGGFPRHQGRGGDQQQQQQQGGEHLGAWRPGDAVQGVDLRGEPSGCVQGQDLGQEVDISSYRTVIRGAEGLVNPRSGDRLQLSPPNGLTTIPELH